MLLVLRLLHIASGVFWAGGSIFAARFIMPALKAAGPAAGPVMAELGKRGIPVAMMGAALVNVASGIWLMVIDASGAPGVFMQSTTRRTLALGGGLAILAVLLGVTVGMPMQRRMGQITAAAQKRGGPPSPDEAAELQRLGQRSGTLGVVAAVLLFLATAAMATARYMP